MITITISETEAGIIINALAELPHRIVHDLVPRLIAQVDGQIERAPSEPTDLPADVHN